MIDEVYMFVAEDSEGEGLIGEVMGDKWIPFVCADKARVESLRSRAIEIGRASGKRIKLIRYSVRELVEVLNDEGI